MSVEPIDKVQGEIYLELCTQIGHLFLSFANLENALTGALKLHMAESLSANESDPKAIMFASAVYGSMRFSTARDAIKRVISTDPPSPEKLAVLTDLFAQVGHVQGFRDMLAHQSLQRSSNRIDGTWRLSNMFTTKDLAKPQVYEFTMAAVNAAASDLVTAASTIGSRRMGTKLIDGLVAEASPIAWRYKPSMLKLLPRSKLNYPQEPEPPLQA